MSPSSTAQQPRVTTQFRHARDEAFMRVIHAALPWAVFGGLTVGGNILYLAFAKAVDHGRWIGLAAGLVLLLGAGLTYLDAHLRRHRMTVVGRLAGPVTIAVGAMVTAAFLLAGYSTPLVMVWLFGGFAAALGWNVWMTHAASHDLTIGFTAAGVKSGIGPAQLVPARQPRQITAGPRPARPAARVTGRVVLPPGEVTPAEAADRAAQLEGAHHWPPGSATFEPADDDAAATDFTLSDPASLAYELPWPGAYAPGTDLSVPFRPGLRQDGLEWLYYLLPLHHMRAAGKTGSGKTMSWLWGFQAEAVTRLEYAAFLFDLVKGMQFVGPLAPAMHGVAITPEQALEQFLALRRARVARLDYLYRQGLTEWLPGCGLTFLDSWMEEAPTVIKQIAALSKGKSGPQAFTVSDWAENAKANRSAGMREDASMQFGKDTEFPTEARGQFGVISFGTSDANESRIALSPAQVLGGARPELWGRRYPGKAYVDSGVDSPDPLPVTMPVRLWSWGQNAALIAAHMSEHPSSGRPLDDITGEAMGNRPADPPSYAYPGEGGRLPGSNLRFLPGGRPEPALDPKQQQALAAETAVRRELVTWLAAGRLTISALELQNTGILRRVDKSRPWLYEVMNAFEERGWVRGLSVKNQRKSWQVLPEIRAGLEQEEA